MFQNTYVFFGGVRHTRVIERVPLAGLVVLAVSRVMTSTQRARVILRHDISSFDYLITTGQNRYLRRRRKARTSTADREDQERIATSPTRQ